jgi:hypothetical protein
VAELGSLGVTTRMGLDIYVGSFTRYYRGDWETVVARAAREQGIGFQVIRTNPDPLDKVTDPVVIGQAVEGWRSSLEAGLRQHLADGLSWDERAEADYFTDKPDWVGYAGVVLLAAHTACPEYPLPDRAIAHFDKDAAYQRLASQEFRCRFSQVFEVEIWLPCAFPFTFKAADVSGNEVRFGSSVTLLEQLRLLNDESYKANAETLARWKFDGAGSQDAFDQTARYGLAMFLHHAQHSVEHRLPMKLDY